MAYEQTRGRDINSANLDATDAPHSYQLQQSWMVNLSTTRLLEI